MASPTVPVKLPQGNWASPIVDKIQNSFTSFNTELNTVDTVKVRKSFNKDEDQFVEAVVRHVMGKFHQQLEEHINSEKARIEKTMLQLKTFISLQVKFDKKEIEIYKENLRILSKKFTLVQYIYENDLQPLKEYKKLCAVSAIKSVGDVTRRIKNDYHKRISERAKAEIKSAIGKYLEETKIPARLVMSPVEPLGALKNLRASYGLGFMFTPKGSEGDYGTFVTSSTKQAYNEDDQSSFTYKKSGVLRQGTCKLNIEITTDPIELNSSQEVLKYFEPVC